METLAVCGRLDGSATKCDHRLRLLQAFGQSKRLLLTKVWFTTQRKDVGH